MRGDERAARGTAKAMRQQNLALVLREVASRGTVSRAGIAATTGLAKATVSSLVEQLVTADLLAEIGRENRGEAGRPGTVLALNRAGPVGIGLEINVDYLAAAAVDLTGAVRALRVRRVDNREQSPSQVLRDTAELAEQVTDAVRAEGPWPAGITVAVPGTVTASASQDSDEPTAPTGGRLTWAPNLGWRDVAVGDELRAAVPAWRDLRVQVDNEANLAALGELWYGGGAGWGDFVQVSGEIGIGAGIVVDRALFRGAHGFAGEFGHLSVEPDGPDCHCGARGCLECYAGQEALLRAAGLVGVPATSVGDPEGAAVALQQAASSGDAAAREALERAGWALGVALAGLVNLIDPDTVVLGGSYARLAAWLLPPLRRELGRRLARRSESAQPGVEVSLLGPHAAVRGAAGAGVQWLLAHPAVPPEASADPDYRQVS